ncbi:hypothetical protein GMMP1_600021 [Candidatus Magnetomoraceae bacterium gMMP-1]
MSLLQSSDGAIWVGTNDGGLARLDYTANQWVVYNEENSDLPTDYVKSLIQSSDNAIWMGTEDGLTRFDYETNQWAVYNTENSDLPDNYVKSLIQSSDGAIWVGMYDAGLCRLSFPNSSYSPGKLILVAGSGAAKTNTLWQTTKELSISTYRTFHNRGFKNTDIYFMSPEKWADFNGDGFDDHIVDCPPANEDRNLTVEDLRYAITDWAVKTYNEGKPLYVYLSGHGYPKDNENEAYFLLSPGIPLYANELNDMLNIYEQETGGQVIMINESCYSGQFLQPLKKQGRITITATTDRIVNYSNWGRNSFTQFFLQKLFENNSLHQAFLRARFYLGKSGLTAEQTPQLDDNGNGKFDDADGLIAANIKLGGDHTMGAPWPEIISVNQSELAENSVSFTLTANAHMKRVWATVQPPDYIPDTSGDYQKIDLEQFNLWDNDKNLDYEGMYDKFNKNGIYMLTFYAKDQFGNVAVSEPMKMVNTVPLSDLEKAVLYLRVLSGATLPAIDNEGKITLKNVIELLQKISDLKN